MRFSFSDGTTVLCTGSTATANIPSNHYALPASVGTVTSLKFTGCTNPFSGALITATNLPYSLTPIAFNGSPSAALALTPANGPLPSGVAPLVTSNLSGCGGGSGIGVSYTAAYRAAPGNKRHQPLSALAENTTRTGWTEQVLACGR